MRISEERFVLMERKSRTDAIFAPRHLQKRYREGKQDLYQWKPCLCSNALAFASAAFAIALAFDSPVTAAFALAFAFDSSAFAFALAFD